GTSYDASHQGFRAAYLLLEELGYPVGRTKRPTGGTIRWVLSPTTGEDKADQLDAWVRAGGILILADNTGDFADAIGIELKVHEREFEPGTEPASGPDIARLGGGKVEVEWPEQQGEIWARLGKGPIVTVYRRGRGELWLVNRPEFLDNRHLRQADNAVLLCRIADEVLRRRPGPLGFDEYCHGMRDRPDVTELLFQPPTLWITLQGLLLVGLLLWHYVPRFGALQAEVVRRRRSKEEFLDAMALLLEWKGNYAEAYRTVHDDLLRDMERDLGLPTGTPIEQILREAGRRRSFEVERFRRVLETDVP